jgi:hypothetical protein
VVCVGWRLGDPLSRGYADSADVALAGDRESEDVYLTAGAGPGFHLGVDGCMTDVELEPDRVPLENVVIAYPVHRASVVADLEGVVGRVCGGSADRVTRVRRWLEHHVRASGAQTLRLRGTATALGLEVSLYGSVESCDAGVVDVVEANESDLQLMDRVSARARAAAELAEDVNECESEGGAGSSASEGGGAPKETAVEVAVAQDEKMKADALMSDWVKRASASAVAFAVTPSFVRAGLSMARYRMVMDPTVDAGRGGYKYGEYVSGFAVDSCRPRLLFVVREDADSDCD